MADVHSTPEEQLRCSRALPAAALARAIEAERQRLFRAQAITKSIAVLWQRTYDVEVGEPDLGYALLAVDELLEAAISGLEPWHLGLPNPSAQSEATEQ